MSSLDSIYDERTTKVSEIITAIVVAVDRVKSTAKVSLPNGDEVWVRGRPDMSVGDVVRVQAGVAYAGTVRWDDN